MAAINTALRIDPALRFALLNRWQHDFPLVDEPYARIGDALGIEAAEVLAEYRALLEEGSVSRIGGVFGAGAGGSALLCAMAVPPARLEAVARQVSAHTGVNHNYQREHHFNLWFVITGGARDPLHAELSALEQATGASALRLEMQRAYVIDLGFDLHGRTAGDSLRGSLARRPTRGAALPVAPGERALAGLLEDGLPLTLRPFERWASQLGLSPAAVLATLVRWLDAGTLRRFGVIVRHHELGFAANAMTVFDVPDDTVDALGTELARQPGVTLAYRRTRAAQWPYNLYCMVHGRDRASVQAALAQAVQRAGLARHAHEVLFSCRRFKQTGARYFREATAQGAHAHA